MNTNDVTTDKLLPREELIKLFCPTDDPDKWAKAVQLALLFKAIDDLGDNVTRLQETWAQIKLVQEEKSQLIVDLSHDRDAWRIVAKDYERRLDELGKL
jgi:hypothetical protein